jgi:preprotein translocase subunit YajC
MDQYSTLILIALMVVAFYFLIMRPQRKRQQAVAKTLRELTPGTRVMLGSGLFGTVVAVGEKQVVLEVSPGNEMTVLKQAVARIVTPDDEDAEVDELAEFEPDEVESEEPTATELSGGPIQPEPIRPAVEPEDVRSSVDPDVEPPATGPGSKPSTTG